MNAPTMRSRSSQELVERSVPVGYAMSATCLRYLHNLQNRNHVRGEIPRVFGVVEMSHLGTFEPEKFLALVQRLAAIVDTKRQRGYLRDLQKLGFLEAKAAIPSHL